MANLEPARMLSNQHMDTMDFPSSSASLPQLLHSFLAPTTTTLALLFILFILHRRRHKRDAAAPVRPSSPLRRTTSLVLAAATGGVSAIAGSHRQRRRGLQRSCSSKRDLGRLRLGGVEDDRREGLAADEDSFAFEDSSPSLSPPLDTTSRLSRSPSPAVSDVSSTVSLASSSSSSAAATPPPKEISQALVDDCDGPDCESRDAPQTTTRSTWRRPWPSTGFHLGLRSSLGRSKAQQQQQQRPVIARRHTTAATAAAAAHLASEDDEKEEEEAGVGSSQTTTPRKNNLLDTLRRRQRAHEPTPDYRSATASPPSTSRSGSITRLSGADIEQLTRQHLSRQRLPQPYEPAFTRPVPSRSGKVWIPHPPNASQEVRSRSQGSHEIYYEVHGNGARKALLIMGLGNTSLAYTAQLQHFAPRGDYSICVFDNRGVGNSDCPRGPWRTSELAEDAVVLLDHLGWHEARNIDLVGVSLGGMIAMELATRISDRLSSLTLCVTTPGHGLLGNMPPMLGLKTSLYLAVTSRKDKRMRAIVDMCFPPAWLDAPADGCKIRNPYAVTNRQHVGLLFAWRIRSEKAMTQLANLLQTGAVLTHRVTHDRLAALDATIPKICVLTGDYDCLVDPRNSFELHKAMPRSELVMWEQTGHAINIQRPTLFNELLERVWREGREGAGHIMG